MAFDYLSKQEAEAMLYLECASIVRKFLEIDKERTAGYCSDYNSAFLYLRSIEQELLRFLKLENSSSVGTECFVAGFLFSALIKAGDCSNFFTYLTQAVVNDVLIRPFEWSVYIDIAKFFIEDSTK
jgi:hypothetical protein